jgi:hypothetical protein
MKFVKKLEIRTLQIIRKNADQIMLGLVCIVIMGKDDVDLWPRSWQK